MKTFSIDITPTTHILSSHKATRMSWPEGLAELVDNAFDAGAKNVVIDLTADGAVSIKDDGQGCSDIGVMLRLGSHHKTKNTKLGMFGVGMKNAALGLGGYLEITTVHKGTRRSAEIDWDEIETSGKWKSLAKEEDTKDVSGTEILIGQIIRKGKPLCIREHLAYIFAPAIWSGRHVVLVSGSDRTAIRPWVIPEMSERIEASAKWDDSIGFKVVAGFVENNSRQPFVFSYEHRIIFETARPCGDFPPSSKFLAFVELFGKWPMLKHKDGLQESEELDWLELQLQETCRPLLEQLQRQGDDVQFDEIATELESIIMHVRGRQKRKPGEDSGTKEPRGTIRIMEEAESVHPGAGDVQERHRNKKRRGFTIRYDHLGEPIGKVEVTNSRTFVLLNEDHPSIAGYKERRDMMSIRAVCYALVADHEATKIDPNQSQMGFTAKDVRERFVSIYSAAMRALAEKYTTHNQQAA